MLTGTSTNKGYKVEARVTTFTSSNPIVIGDQILSERWTDMRFPRTDIPAIKKGVPGIFSLNVCDEYFTFESALSLAWSIIAQNQYRSVECRIVQYKIVQTHEVTKEGAVSMPIIKESWGDKKCEPPEVNSTHVPEPKPIDEIILEQPKDVEGRTQ